MEKVSVVCIDCDSDYIDNLLLSQTYQNLEVVETTTRKEFYQDIVQYCGTADQRDVSAGKS